MKPVTLFATLAGLAITMASPSAETIRYTPTTFFDIAAPGATPALRIKSGDRVTTSTMEGDHALIGPFAIDGAAPGDLLVVTIHTLAPAGTSASSSPILTTNAVDVAFGSNKDATRLPWTIDTKAGVARLDMSVFKGVDWKTRFSPATFEVPLRPALATIGVAPATGNATNTPGRHGGTLNYGGITAGTRVFLPVSQTGAQLFLGRGQVSQSEGLLTGAVETALTVDFSVEVVKKKEWPHSSVIRPSTVVGEFEMDYPRLETDAYLMAVGSAPTLQQALQRATLEMHHWIDDDFGLNERAVSVFMGQAMEYELGTLAGPTYTVVAKVKKAYLPTPLAN